MGNCVNFPSHRLPVVRPYGQHVWVLLGHVQHLVRVAEGLQAPTGGGVLEVEVAVADSPENTKKIEHFLYLVI